MKKYILIVVGIELIAQIFYPIALQDLPILVIINTYLIILAL